MRFLESKSDMVFKVEDIINAEQRTVHTRSIVPYPVSRQGAQASNELVEKAARFDKKYHHVDAVTGLQTHEETYEVRMR